MSLVRGSRKAERDEIVWEKAGWRRTTTKNVARKQFSFLFLSLLFLQCPTAAGRKKRRRRRKRSISCNDVRNSPMLKGATKKNRWWICDIYGSKAIRKNNCLGRRTLFLRAAKPAAAAPAAATGRARRKPAAAAALKRSARLPSVYRVVYQKERERKREKKKPFSLLLLFFFSSVRSPLNTGRSFASLSLSLFPRNKRDGGGRLLRGATRTHRK